MKLFKGWLKSDKAVVAPSKVDKDEVTGSETVKTGQLLDDKVLKRERKKFVERYQKMGILVITATADEESFEIHHKDVEKSLGGRCTLHPKTKITKDGLLEYIQSIESAEVSFKGPLLKIQDLLKSIPNDWYPKHVAKITVTDGLSFATKHDSQKWSDVVLHIFTLYIEFFEQETPIICFLYVNTDPGVFKVFSKLSEDKFPRFSVHCPYMHLTQYETVRQDLFVGTRGRSFAKREHWDLASKIIREEADSYEENGNIINYVINGVQKRAGFEPLSK